MQAGYWVHRAAYRTQKGHGKILVRDEPLASIVQEAFEGYASGRFQTQAEIKRFFEGFPAFPRDQKGTVTQQRVTDILTHPIYTGHIPSAHSGLSWFKGHHEALITLELFDRVQTLRQGTQAQEYRRCLRPARHDRLCRVRSAAAPLPHPRPLPIRPLPDQNLLELWQIHSPRPAGGGSRNDHQNPATLSRPDRPGHGHVPPRVGPAPRPGRRHPRRRPPPDRGLRQTNRQAPRPRRRNDKCQSRHGL
ncbi:recombinase family protein [Pelagibaca abyssi]|nr:recombinase family protein [Salipiger abyssi]